MCVCESVVCWVGRGKGCGDQWFGASSGGRQGLYRESIVTFRREDSSVNSSEDTTRVWDVGHCERDVFQQQYERGSLASVSKSIGAPIVIADAEGPGWLAKSKTRVREPDEKGSGAGEFADSGNVKGYDGRRGVGARIGASDSKDKAATFSAAAWEFEILSGLKGGVGTREPA